MNPRIVYEIRAFRILGLIVFEFGIPEINCGSRISSTELFGFIVNVDLAENALKLRLFRSD